MWHHSLCVGRPDIQLCSQAKVDIWPAYQFDYTLTPWQDSPISSSMRFRQMAKSFISMRLACQTLI